MDLNLINTLLSILSSLLTIVCLLGLDSYYARKHDRRSKFESFILHLKYGKSSFFYDEKLTKQIVVREPELEKNKYIDYTQIDYTVEEKDKFYLQDRKVEKIKIDGKVCEEGIQLPYKILIDYIKDGSHHIYVDKMLPEKYQLSPEMIELTQPVFDDFLQSKPNTFNDSTMRIASLEHNEENNTWKCILQESDYFTQVRTNLTLDVQLQNEYNREYSMRLIDITKNGPDTLIDFDKSILANNIGVSAVWNFRRGDKNMYFLKPRKNTTGVFCDMLGTVSGVVKYTDGLESKYLEDYMCEEILREFYEETGYDKYMIDNNIPESEIKVIPLAFAREFARGGKPQFFFRILTPEISNKDIITYYKKSLNGFEEFDDTFVKNHINMLSLSPETRTNFILAFKDIQKDRGKDYIDLD